MLKFNSNILKWNGKWGNASTAPSTVYHVYTYTDGNGTLTAVPVSGISGTEVTLSNTPNEGYDFAEYQVEGASVSGDTLTIEHSDVSVTALFEEQAVTYNYFTFKAKDTGTYTCDQAYMCAKKYNNGSYLKDLDTGTVYSIDGMDAMKWTLTAGHTYELCWSDTDITLTRNYNTNAYNSSSYPSIYSDSSSSPPRHLAEVYSMDFWHKPYWTNFNMSNVTVIPQSAANIHRGAELISCANLFKNAPITNSIEKFILAMQIACPNLTTTTGCFSGCTTAPDYNYCLSHYPAWF